MAVAPLRSPDLQGQLPSSHVVRFYERDALLLDLLADGVRTALAQGRAAIVIATPDHQEALERRLRASGLDPAAASADGLLMTYDAADTLAAFMVDGRPDRLRFMRVVGDAVATAERRSRQAPVFAFGEMVALLWARGQTGAAIELEELWNDLLRVRPVALMCAYPIKGFATTADGPGASDVAATHTEVFPADEAPADRERTSLIAELQQKAAALEAEVAHRRAVEVELRRAKAHLDDFVENAVEGIHRVGPDGTILWANDAELRMLGYTREEYVGRHIAEFHVDRPRLDAILQRLLTGDALYDEPAQMRCKDGSVKHVLIHSNGYWEEGKFVHTRCFTRDVTDRVALEGELRRKVEQLAELDRRKDEFLAMLGHELRNPLAPATSALELLRLRANDPVQVARLREIVERQISRMTRLIDDLLDVARIVRGRIELREERIGVSTILEHAIELVRPLLDERGLRLSVDLPAAPVTVTGDRMRLEQVVGNLLNNAAKFSDMGGHIWIRAWEDGGEIAISVRDDGAGMSPELLARVFDLFVQGPDSGPRGRGGLGVGLTLVRRLVELHGGRVEARSDGLGQGSEFLVWIPVRTGAKTPPPAAETARAARRRVVVIDDNVDASESLGELLRELGHDARTAHGAAAGIAEVERAPADVALVDIAMPDMDGYAVARRIAATRPSVRLIALTGYGDERHRALARDAGFADLVAKPISVADLERVLAS